MKTKNINIQSFPLIVQQAIARLNDAQRVTDLIHSPRSYNLNIQLLRLYENRLRTQYQNICSGMTATESDALEKYHDLAWETN